MLPVRSLSEEWPDEAKTIFVEKVLLNSPAADPAMLARAGTRSTTVDVLTGGNRADPYYESHLLPFGFRYEVQFMAAGAGRGGAFITFSRKAAAGDFDAGAMRLLDALSSHVSAGMQAATARRMLAAQLRTQLD